MLNVSAYPICAKKLHFQQVNLSDPLMTHYWAAVCVVSDISDVVLKQATEFDFNFDDRSEKNGRKLMSELEKFMLARQQRTAENAGFAHNGVTSMLGGRGVKTSMPKSEDDFWTAAETLFPGRITRKGGLGSLYFQITEIPKKQRKKLADENFRKLPADWISDASVHAAKLTDSKPRQVEAAQS